MSTSAQRRLLKDLKRIQNQPGDEIIASPQGSNLLRWTATIEGIDETPWEGGLFQLKLDFSEQYPNKPPAVKFTSQMFHPNIYNDGRICLDMLQNQWSPVYDVWSILTAIRSLLADPNTLSPANNIASTIFKDNKMQYEQKVREIVEKSLDYAANEDEQLKEEEPVVEEPEEEEVQQPLSFNSMQPVASISFAQNWGEIARIPANFTIQKATMSPNYTAARVVRRRAPVNSIANAEPEESDQQDMEMNESGQYQASDDDSDEEVLPANQNLNLEDDFDDGEDLQEGVQLQQGEEAYDAEDGEEAQEAEQDDS